jgi:hypothetical protein
MCELVLQLLIVYAVLMQTGPARRASQEPSRRTGLHLIGNTPKNAEDSPHFASSKNFPIAWVHSGRIETNTEKDELAV